MEMRFNGLEIQIPAPRKWPLVLILILALWLASCDRNAQPVVGEEVVTSNRPYNVYFDEYKGHSYIVVRETGAYGVVSISITHDESCTNPIHKKEEKNEEI
jgi:hypothetical protein